MKKSKVKRTVRIPAAPTSSAYAQRKAQQAFPRTLSAPHTFRRIGTMVNQRNAYMDNHGLVSPKSESRTFESGERFTTKIFTHRGLALEAFIFASEPRVLWTDNEDLYF